MLAIMLDPKLKDLFILSNYVGIENNTISAIRYDSKILVFLVSSTY
jgi:hypothetical protein